MERRRIKGIIFDLDGVILSTDRFHLLAWKKMCEENGIAFDEGVGDRLRGVSRMDSLNIILEGYGKPFTEEEKASLCDRKNSLYREYLSKLTPLDVSEEVMSTLMEIKGMGYKMAIGSSSKNAKFILGRVGLSSYFDEIADGNMIKHSKPDPEVFLLAAKLLGLEPSDCIVLEDAYAGVKAAKRGGFIAVGIGDARTSPDSDHPIDRFLDIIKILKSLG